MYNDVIGALGGRLEQVFSIGGDDALNSGPKAIVNRFKPVVTFLGPFTLKKGEKQKHTIEMPNYNGRVRVMVVAGDGSAYGHTDKSVMVRRPVMLLGTLPRVIGVNETMTVPATVFATEKGIGQVKVSISCSGNMSVEGPQTVTLDFDNEGDKQAFFTVTTGPTPGAGKVVLTAESKKGKVNYDTDIEVRSVSRPVMAVTAGTIPAGGQWNGTVEVPGMDGTNDVTLEISTVPPVNLSSRLEYLIGYPHGCIEQITSKGFPQLYLKNFTALTQQQQRITSDAVKEVISRQRSYQTAEGGFSYWPGGTSTHAWGTIYATHFQLEAELQGYLVPEGMKTAALNNLRLVARNFKTDGLDKSNRNSEIVTQAYRLYVLALSGNAETGAMNRLREHADLASTARFYLAAAYAQAGRTDTAKELLDGYKPVSDYKYGQYDYTFGSVVRDRAVQLIATLLVGDDLKAAEISATISDELASKRWMSTQTTAYALMAMSRLYENYLAEGVSLDYTYGSVKGKVASEKIINTVEIGTGLSGSTESTIVNNGKSGAFLRWIAFGIPPAGEETAYENRIKVDVYYTDLKGNRIEVSNLEQGTNFKAVVTVENPSLSAYNNIVITQIFPSGWEILSTRFASEGSADNYPDGVNYQDIRDDRVYSYIDRFNSRQRIRITLNLAAVYQGRFHLPPVYAEAMYDNDIRANTAGGTAEVTRDR